MLSFTGNTFGCENFRFCGNLELCSWALSDAFVSDSFVCIEVFGTLGGGWPSSQLVNGWLEATKCFTRQVIRLKFQESSGITWAMCSETVKQPFSQQTVIWKKSFGRTYQLARCMTIYVTFILSYYLYICTLDTKYVIYRYAWFGHTTTYKSIPADTTSYNILYHYINVTIMYHTFMDLPKYSPGTGEPGAWWAPKSWATKEGHLPALGRRVRRHQQGAKTKKFIETPRVSIQFQ